MLGKIKENLSAYSPEETEDSRDEESLYTAYFKDLQERGARKSLSPSEELALWHQYFAAKDIIECFTPLFVNGTLSPHHVNQLQQAQDEFTSARTTLFERNSLWVAKIARKYSVNFLHFLDLVQEGNLGLLKAIERFDLAYNCRLTTYSKDWIRQSIRTAIFNQEYAIRVPYRLTPFYKKEHTEPEEKNSESSTDIEDENQVIPTAKNFSDFDSDERHSYENLADEEFKTEEHATDNLQKYKAQEFIRSILHEFTLNERIVLTMRHGIIHVLERTELEQYISPATKKEFTQQQIETLLNWPYGLIWNVRQIGDFMYTTHSYTSLLDKRIKIIIQTKYGQVGKQLVEESED